MANHGFDRCKGCGTYARSYNIDSVHLYSDGTYGDTRFWFCDEQCYLQTLHKFPNVYDEDGYVDIGKTVDKFHAHLEGESKYLKDREDEEAREWFARRDEQLDREVKQIMKDREREELRRQEAERKEREKLEAEEKTRLEFEEMLKPKYIPEEVRFEHLMCLGPSRSGKTTLLQQIFLDDMARPNPPAGVRP
jgi:hypothetical protein